MTIKEFSMAVGSVLGYYKERVKNLKAIADINRALKEIGTKRTILKAKEEINKICLQNSLVELEDRIRRSISEILIFEDTNEKIDIGDLCGYYFKEQA